MNINNLFAGMGLNPSGVTGGSSSDSGNSSGSPQDIPKEELMNLCMKMNKRMQAMETKGKELVRKKALLLSERHRLLELMKTVMPVPVLSKEDSDLDIDTVERNWAEFENTRKNHTIAMEEKLLKKEQTAQQDIAALEARFRRQIADLQSGTAVADGSTSGTSDSTTNVTPKVGLNEDVEKDLMMAKQSLQEYQQRVVKADCEVERLRSAESVWKQQGHSMEAVIADKNNELDQLHKSYQASKTALEEKVVALQLQINNAKHQGAEKEELLSSNRSQTEKLNGQIAALQRLIEEKDLSNKSNKDMIAALQARLIELEPELAQARDRVSQQERNAQASRVMKAEQDALSESLRRDLKNSLEEAEASRRRINELEEYKVKAEGQLLKLASLTETVATMQSSVDEKESLLVRLRAEQATAERNHAMRTAMLATAEARLEQATNDLAAKDNTIQEVVDRVAALQTQLSTSEARLQERVAAAAQERSELEQQLSGLEETSLSMRKSMQQQFAEELEALNRDHAKKSSMARTLLSEREEEVRVLSTKNLQLTEEIQSGAPQERRIFELAQTQSRREALHGVHGDTRELAFQQIQSTLANRDLDLARAHQVLSSLQKEVVDLRRTHKRDGINMDYLKNIVIQYMTFPVNSSEKMSLVPVLAMLLQFTPKELAQVQRAQLENPVHSSPSIWSPFGLGGGGGTSAASISSLTSSSTPKEIGRKLTTSAAAGSSSSSASASGAGAAGGGGPGRVMSGPALTASALAAAHAKASSKAYASTTGAGAGASFYQTPQANKLRTNSSVSNASTSSSNQSDGGGEGQHFTQQYPQHTHTTSSKQHYDINNNIVSPITATPASPATGTAAAARGGGGGGGGVIGGETIHIGSYNPHTNNSALMIETAEGEDINSTASEFSTPVHSGGRAANAANIAHINHHASNPNDSAIYHLSSGSASRSTSQQSGFGFIGITTSTTTAHSANINNTNNVDNDDGGSAAMELMSESQAAAADRGIVLHHHNTRSYHGDSMNSLTSMSSKSHSGKYTPPTLTAVAGNANNNNNNNNNNDNHEHSNNSNNLNSSSSTSATGRKMPDRQAVMNTSEYEFHEKLKRIGADPLQSLESASSVSADDAAYVTHPAGERGAAVILDSGLGGTSV